MKKIVIVLLILFLSSLSLKCQTAKFIDNNIKNIRISYQELINYPRIIELSEVASSVEYIKLETNDNCLIIANQAKYYFAGSFIFVSNKDHVLKYSQDGKFLKKIGKLGNGPGEINGILSMSILLGKELIVILEMGGRRLSYFSFEGNFIKSVKIPPTIKLLMMDNGNYITYDENSYSKYIFRLSNEHGDTISAVQNKYKWINNSQNKMSASPSYPCEPFYYYDNNYYFKARHTDTVFSIFSNKIKPYCFIDLGRYRLPDELRPERDLTKFLEKRFSYYYCSVFEVSNKLFLSCSSYGNAPAKFLYFDMKTLKGCLLVNKSGQSTGFINDWDGGFDFCPVGNINNNKAYMPINILELKEMLSKNNQNAVKNKGNKILLEKLIHDSDILDNPLLMVVTIK